MTTTAGMALSSADRPPTVKTQTLELQKPNGSAPPPQSHGHATTTTGGGNTRTSHSPRRRSNSTSSQRMADADSVNALQKQQNAIINSGALSPHSAQNAHNKATPSMAGMSTAGGVGAAIGSNLMAHVQPGGPLNSHGQSITTASHTPSGGGGGHSPESSFRGMRPEKQSALLSQAQNSQSNIHQTGTGGGGGGGGAQFTALPASSAAGHQHHMSSSSGDGKTSPANAVHSTGGGGGGTGKISPHSGRGGQYLVSHPEEQTTNQQTQALINHNSMHSSAQSTVGVSAITLHRNPSFPTNSTSGANGGTPHSLADGTGGGAGGGGGGNTLPSPKQPQPLSNRSQPAKLATNEKESGDHLAPQSGASDGAPPRGSMTPTAMHSSGPAPGTGHNGIGRITKHNYKDFDRKGAYVCHDSGVKASENNGYALKITSGVYGMQGARTSMEDKHSVLPHPDFNKTCNLDDGVPRSFFAVYDGHGGYVAAEYSRQHVHKNFVTDAMFGIQTEFALKNGLLKTEHDFCSACRKKQLLSSSGTCAVVAYIQGTTLVVANVGDSRSVLSTGQRSLPLSVDHKPARPDERERIEALGGRVGRTEDEAFGREAGSSSGGGGGGGGCMCIKGMFGDEKPLRIFPGGLSVSRTIGDIALKATQLITAEPELTVRQLTLEDNAVILACDGVWDVMNDAQAADLVRKHLDDPNKAARMLSFEAYRRGSKDNISVVVVALNWVKTNS